MSGQITRLVGETLYLEAQLYDLDVNAANVRIIADLVQQDGTIYTTVELTHTSKGVFLDNTEVMPNQPVVYTKYYTYELDGITLHPDYSVVEERYMRSTVPSVVINNQSVSGTVLSGPSSINGTIQSANINGTIKTVQPSVNGTLSSQKIEGTVKNE